MNVKSILDLVNREFQKLPKICGMKDKGKLAATLESEVGSILASKLGKDYRHAVVRSQNQKTPVRPSDSDYDNETTSSGTQVQKTDLPADTGGEKENISNSEENSEGKSPGSSLQAKLRAKSSNPRQP